MKAVKKMTVHSQSAKAAFGIPDWYSTQCCKCCEEFTDDNPCFNDSGYMELLSGERFHSDGECRQCYLDRGGINPAAQAGGRP